MLNPRRVRRRLLLPPGWVALGFLLLLGCQALQPWAGQLKVWNVMQITMLPLQGERSLPVEINKFRNWHDITFNGNQRSDFFNAAATEAAIRKINADSSHDGGVRVRFNSGSTYANLVRVLDIMSYTGQEKYGLDIRYQPATLYAITNRSQAYSWPPRDCMIISSSVSTKLTLAQKLVEFEKQLIN